MDGKTSLAEVQASLLQTGSNCWKVEQATRVGLIVDGADYFKHLRTTLIAARREVLLIGWDFDFEIDMLPGESDEQGHAPDGYPNALGPFLVDLVERTPELRLYLLKWNGAVLIAPARVVPSLVMHLWSHQRIRFALDGHHPFGACHHQKIVVVDDALAFCGGIDTTENRWDTSDHTPGDPRRVHKDGTPAPPWHDVTAAMTGPVVDALADLARTRWRRATGEALEDPGGQGEATWPDGLGIAAENVDIAIARTEPPYDGEPLVHEIEQLYLDGIAAAKNVIYLESQYFAGESICAALERRLREPDGPEVVIINPQAALNPLEDRAMHVIRGRMIARLNAADHGGRFRMWHPVNGASEPIYVHAKVMVVDDSLLRIGSSNLNDRSMGFDTECDVAMEGQTQEVRRSIADFRLRLLSEHLGVSPGLLSRTWEQTGSLIAAVERLNAHDARGLRDIEVLPEGQVQRFLADTRLLDPRYDPGEPTAAGRGLRPRHAALAAALLIGLGAAVWAWRHPRSPRPARTSPEQNRNGPAGQISDRTKPHPRGRIGYDR